MELVLKVKAQRAHEFLEYLKTLDYVKVKKEKKVPLKTSLATAQIETEILEEDENGIPLKYKEEIMALSKAVNKGIAQRWNADNYKDEL
jgi:hypothetical protein